MALYTDEYGIHDDAFEPKKQTAAAGITSSGNPFIDAAKYASDPMYKKVTDMMVQQHVDKFGMRPEEWKGARTAQDYTNWDNQRTGEIQRQIDAAALAAAKSARTPIVNAAPPVYSVNATLPKPTTTSMFGAMPTAGPAFGANAGVNNAMGAYVTPGTNGGTFSGMQAAAQQQALAPSLVQQLLGRMFGSTATQQVQSAIDKRNNPAPTTTTPATTTSSSGNSMFGSFNPSMQNTFVNPAMTGYRGGGGSQWRGMWG